MNKTQNRMRAVAVRLRKSDRHVPTQGALDQKAAKSDQMAVGSTRLWRPVAISAVAAASMMLASTQASASDVFMRIGSFTSQPIGHFEYCKNQAADCAIRAHSPHARKLTRQLWAEVVEINHKVNTTVRAVTDQELFGKPEHWVLPDEAGDCEDFALMKRKMLMERGWPASTLLVTVVRQPNGEAHAVLTVRTDRGDFILDNLDGRILSWDKTEYRFLKRQSAKHSGKWEVVFDDRPLSNGNKVAIRNQ